ncbi:hypothetical protein BC332_21664 [Capsicum chinense]|nr:hypothetical protein BC332_21664 [Capsicum chinense]
MHETDVFSWTSMLVAYIRASRLADACSLFDSMPVRNVVAWTALITGFAQNGEGEKALCVFKEMLEEGIVPNASTYVTVLGACADIPLIEKGKQLHGHIFGYTRLIDLHNVFVVNVLIDMYCKSGDMISAMTLFERVQGNLELAKRAAEEPDNAARYIMLSNIYTAAGRWNDARRLRRLLYLYSFSEAQTQSAQSSPQQY